MFHPALIPDTCGDAFPIGQGLLARMLQLGPGHTRREKAQDRMPGILEQYGWINELAIGPDD